MNIKRDIHVQNVKPISHFALGLRFGEVFQQKCEENMRKMQLARVFTQRIV